MSDLSEHPIVSVYATFGSEEEARRIALQLVEEGLAACANILASCHSVRRRQGAIEETREVPVILKTRGDGAVDLIERIGALHSSDMPPAVAWPIVAALCEYRDWILGSGRSG